MLLNIYGQPQCSKVTDMPRIEIDVIFTTFSKPIIGNEKINVTSSVPTSHCKCNSSDRCHGNGCWQRKQRTDYQGFSYCQGGWRQDKEIHHVEEWWWFHYVAAASCRLSIRGVDDEFRQEDHLSWQRFFPAYRQTRTGPLLHCSKRLRSRLTVSVNKEIPIRVRRKFCPTAGPLNRRRAQTHAGYQRREFRQDPVHQASTSTVLYRSLWPARF